MVTPAPKFDILCAGIIAVDFVGAPITRLPASGGLVKTPKIEMTIGGCAANTSVDLAKLDMQVGIVGLTGADAMGRFMRDALNEEHVNTEHLGESDQVQTSATLIVNVQGEDRRFIHAVGANAEFTGEALSREVIEHCRILSIGGFALNSKLSGENVRQAFQIARQLGVKTVLDVVIGDPEPAWGMLQEVLPETDLFLPNQDEGKLILGIDDPYEQARHFHAAGAKTVVITRGAQGTIMFDGETLWDAAAFPVEQVDGTGGGDAFVAGYLYGMLNGSAPLKCLTYGSAMGASCVRAAGATTSVFRRDELEDFVGNHSLPYRLV